MEDKIRPVYEELIGFMAQAEPQSSVMIYNSSIWEVYHGSIDELIKLTGDDYCRYKLTLKFLHGSPNACVSVNEYRTKLNGLIMRLHAKYFKKDDAPFSGTPRAIINQQLSQSQLQVVQITMLMDFQSVIDKKLYGDKTLDEKQKTFLGKVKDFIPTAKSIADILNTILTVAKTTGLTLADISKLFG